MSQPEIVQGVKLLPWVAWFAFSFGLSAQGGQVEQRGEQAALLVSISCAQTRLTEREPVVLEVKLTNTSDEKLSVFGQLLWGHAGGLRLHVVDARGDPVAAEQLDDDMLVPSVLGDPAAYVVLLPEHFLGVRRTDSVKNLFRRSGKYSIVVEYQSPVPTHYAKSANFWGREKGLIRSAPVEIEVVKD